MSRPPRICSSCGNIHSVDVLCDRQREQQRARNARHDANRPSAHERGYNAAWRKARAEFLRIFPWCACGAAATLVDHKTPHRGNDALFWDRTNWQPLCTHCHNSLKQREERGQVSP